MKSGVNYVKLSAFVALAEAMGLKLEQKKGWIKVTGPSAGAVVYLRDTKQCGVVHVSGKGHPKAIDNPKPPTGKCKWMLDFSRADKDVLRDLAAVFHDNLGGELKLEEEPTEENTSPEEPAFEAGEPDPIAATGDAPRE